MRVRKCFNAYELGLQETVTDFFQEQNEAMKNQLDKLVIGKIRLPDPYSLVDGWCNVLSHLPNTLGVMHLVRTCIYLCTCAFQEVRNVSFSENFVNLLNK